ncbi:MAG TPA: ComEC/Rec2 family competence protein [Methanomassiliicoccales archaeon]|jgi:beta-lactamase superfamily II metal-dependent hydrolase
MHAWDAFEMRSRTKLLLIVIVVVMLVVLASIVVSFGKLEDRPEGVATLRTISSDASTAVIGLNGVGSGHDLYLDGAVIRLGHENASGLTWGPSYTVNAGNWQAGVQRLVAVDPSVIISDRDQDRKMGPDDRIQVTKDGNETATDMVIGVTFLRDQESICFFSFENRTGHTTLVSFIDVGQGDSVLVSTADSHIILIDAGPPLAAGTLISYLHNRSVSVIDALIVTHPDSDHLGGAADILRDFTVLSIYHPGVAKSTSAYSSFIRAAEDEGCPVHTAADTHAGEYLNLTASATIEVLNIDPTAHDVNDASIVLEMRTSGKSFLFTGDISTDVESRLIANHSFDLDVDVLKVGHHGSRTSTSNAFLDATSPETAVICVGVNTYGHPTNDTLTRLFAHDVTVLRTDQMGTIDITA